MATTLPDVDVWLDRLIEHDLAGARPALSDPRCSIGRFRSPIVERTLFVCTGPLRDQMQLFQFIASEIRPKPSRPTPIQVTARNVAEVNSSCIIMPSLTDAAQAAGNSPSFVT